jgi:hypothetical protein
LCAPLTNIGIPPGGAGDNYQALFTVPKEIPEPGCRYRLVVIVKHKFDGPPV